VLPVSKKSVNDGGGDVGDMLRINKERRTMTLQKRKKGGKRGEQEEINQKEI